MRTIVVAVLGLLVLLAAVPEWAVEPVLIFAALYAILIVLVDDEVRALFVRKARAKSPAARRAAT